TFPNVLGRSIVENYSSPSFAISFRVVRRLILQLGLVVEYCYLWVAEWLDGIYQSLSAVYQLVKSSGFLSTQSFRALQVLCELALLGALGTLLSLVATVARTPLSEFSNYRITIP